MLEVFLEVWIRDFIKTLELAICLPFFLNCIIRQMNKLVLNVLQTVLFAGSPNVPIFVPVSLNDSIYCGDQNVASNIEFSLIVQKRIFHIFLNQGRAHSIRRTVRSYEVFNIVQWPCNHTTISSVWVLSRLAYPYVPAVSLVLLLLMNLPSFQEFLVFWVI